MQEKKRKSKMDVLSWQRGYRTWTNSGIEGVFVPDRDSVAMPSSTSPPLKHNFEENAGCEDGARDLFDSQTLS